MSDHQHFRALRLLGHLILADGTLLTKGGAKLHRMRFHIVRIHEPVIITALSHMNAAACRCLETPGSSSYSSSIIA